MTSAAGLPQIGVLVVLAMLAAVILGGGELLVSEAAVSAILVATVSSTPEVRLLDVLIGGGVALAVHTLVFPPDPRVGVARATNGVFGELGAVLRDTGGVLIGGDVLRGEAAAQAAESVELHVRQLRQVGRRSCTPPTSPTGPRDATERNDKSRLGVAR